MNLSIPIVFILYGTLPLTAALGLYSLLWAWRIHQLCRRLGTPWLPIHHPPSVEWRGATRHWFIAKAVYLWGSVGMTLYLIDTNGYVSIFLLLFSLLTLAYWLVSQVWAYAVWLRLPLDDNLPATDLDRIIPRENRAKDEESTDANAGLGPTDNQLA